VDETEQNNPELDAQQQLVEQLLGQWLEQRRQLETVVMLAGCLLWFGLVGLALSKFWTL
jgi:hypothetical protein